MADTVDVDILSHVELLHNPLGGDPNIPGVRCSLLVAEQMVSTSRPVHGENCQAGLVDGVLLQDQVGHLVRPVTLPHLGVVVKPVNDDHQMFY